MALGRPEAGGPGPGDGALSLGCCFMKGRDLTASGWTAMLLRSLSAAGAGTAGMDNPPYRRTIRPSWRGGAGMQGSDDRPPRLPHGSRGKAGCLSIKQGLTPGADGPHYWSCGNTLSFADDLLPAAAKEAGS